MSIYKQLIRFLGIGGVCTLLQYLILILLVSLFYIDPVVSSTIGYLTSSVFNYFLNKIYTFKSTVGHRKAAPRFIVIMASGLLLNAFSLGIANSYFGLHYLVAQIFATIVTLGWNFSANRAWTFDEKSRSLLK